MPDQTGKYVIEFQAPELPDLVIEADTWRVTGDIVTFWRDEQTSELAPLPVSVFIGSYKFRAFYILDEEK